MDETAKLFRAAQRDLDVVEIAGSIPAGPIAQENETNDAQSVPCTGSPTALFFPYF